MTNTWNTFLTSTRRFFDAIIARLTRIAPVDDLNTSWAQVIKSYAAVPEVFKGFFEPLLADGRPFPYTVLTPTFEGYFFTTTEKLICNLDRDVCVLERNGDSYISRCYPLDKISYVEVGTVLLDSRIKICGETIDGLPASSAFKFNAVTDLFFDPVLDTIRLAGVGSPGDPRISESEKFNPWMGLSFKFMNYAKRSLLGGERVISAILQPEIRVTVLTFLGKKIYRRISPMVASILTDRELILIQEEEKQIATERYGGHWDFIPLQKIVELSASPRNADLLVLTIQLPHHEHLECLFQSSAKREIGLLIDRFKELTAAEAMR